VSKHTPGPWTEVGRYIETDECTICEMFSARTREERDANQRLIAAAPELLGALRLALESHGRMLMSDPPQDAWKAYGVEEKARAAIAKAMEVKP
jgi:hypothetical protein